MKFCKVRDVKTPVRGTEESAGIDFFVPNDYPVTVLKHGESVKIPSGIKVKIPKGTCLKFVNKSGVASKKNLDRMAELVDSDYQGEVHINVINNGLEDQTISPGDKIIQAIMFDVRMPAIIQCEDESELYKGVTTERGEGGFGSTGDN